MIGPACIMRARQTARRMPIGTASIILRCDCGRSTGVHSRSIPARVMVTRIARPERMIRAMNVHVDGVILSWKRSNPSIIANFAIKPERGGRPDSNNEQKMKQTPDRKRNTYELQTLMRKSYAVDRL